MSRDEENEYFADGLSEELLNVLAKIRGLRVASRTSAFSFKGKGVDIPTIAQKLNVATVLEGSVRRSGKRVRITVQLIEVASDSHLWSETYDRELDDIFAVQDDIAQSVVKELRAALLGAPAEPTTTSDDGGRGARGRRRAQRQSRGLPALPAGKVLRRAHHAGRHRQGDCAVQAGACARPGFRAGVDGAVADPPGAGGVWLRADRRRLRACPRGRAARAGTVARPGRSACRARPGAARPRLGLGRGGRVVPARAGARSRRRPRADGGGRARAGARPVRRGARTDAQGSRAGSALGANASPDGADPRDGRTPGRGGGGTPDRARPQSDRRPDPRVPGDHASDAGPRPGSGWRCPPPSRTTSSAISPCRWSITPWGARRNRTRRCTR